MSKNNHRNIALKLMIEQLENTYYSLEREEYKDLTEDEIESISMEINRVCVQFRNRYKID